MLLDIHPANPNARYIEIVKKKLEEDGVIIYPTDTVYGLGCDIFSKKGVERICRIRGLDPQKAQLSFICSDISQVSEYTTQIDNDVFRLMKQHLPGPFTFILKANNTVPKILKNRRATIGVRVPNNKIILELVRSLGRPILTTSLKSDDELLEYFTEAEDIYDDFGKLVDIVIDGGTGQNVPSTIIDCTGSTPTLIREGAGQLSI